MTRLLLIAALLLPTLAGAQTASLVCFVGDSTTIGIPYVSGRMAWPQRIQLNRQGQRFSVVNMGIGGLRCNQVEPLVFLVDVVASLKSRGCTRVVIQCGINDLLQNLTADQIYGAAGTPGVPGSDGSSTTPGPLLRMVNAATAAGIQVTVVTVTPLLGSYNYPAGVQTQHMDVNARIRAKSGVTTPSMVTVVDVYRSMASNAAIATALATDPGDGVAIAAPYNFGDGIHYTSGNGSVIDGTTGDGRMAQSLNAVTGALP